jgi:electron transport complex protein RnfD
MKISGKPDLILSTSPFLHTEASTPKIMREVVLALVPVLVAACWYFGIGVLLVVGSATVGAVGTEWIFSRSQQYPTLRDNSALLTGLLLGLVLPPGFPLWMAFLGGVASIGLGKLIWGGLGQNVFNPALVGRAFLQASFPTAVTTWVAPSQGVLKIHDGLFATPLMQAATDTVSTATPLGLAKFSKEFTDALSLLTGNIGGSIGETSGFLLILCGLWLGFRKVFDWRLPVSTIVSVAAFSAIFYFWDPQNYPSPVFMVCSGSLLFGAVFMVTDPVTTPTTYRGAWVFGIGVGFLVVLIRLFGGLPEGVMYAILLMNAATPYINHYTQPRQFGG